MERTPGTARYAAYLHRRWLWRVRTGRAVWPPSRRKDPASDASPVPTSINSVMAFSLLAW